MAVQMFLQKDDMAIDEIKKYLYTPPYNVLKDKPSIQTFSNIHSRLTAGGMFFRSKNTGKYGNDISISGTISGNNYILSVIGAIGRFNTTFTGTIGGMLSTLIITDTTIPKFTLTAISETQFNLTPGNSIITVGEYFKSDLISLNISPKIDSKYYVDEKFEIVNLGFKEIYTIAIPQPTILVPAIIPVSHAITIANLRTAINTNSNMIIMPIRGTDPNDTNIDGTVMENISSNLSGGDGLPLNAIGVKTGPYRALVHLNYSEDANGNAATIAKIFEWAGNNSIIGSWKQYN